MNPGVWVTFLACVALAAACAAPASDADAAREADATLSTTPDGACAVGCGDARDEGADLDATRPPDDAIPGADVPLDDAGRSDVVHAPTQLCAAETAVDIEREGIRIGRSLRWFGDFADAPTRGMLTPGEGCPPVMFLQRVLRFRPTVAGDLSVWGMQRRGIAGGRIVVGRITRCADGETIVRCDAPVRDAEVGRELLFVVGLQVDRWSEYDYATPFTVGVEEGLRVGRSGERCHDGARDLVTCPTGTLCTARSRWSDAYCEPPGRPRGLCDMRAEAPCGDGLCRDGLCRDGVPEGQSCYYAVCGRGLYCDNDLYCKRPGTVGTPCRGTSDPAGPCEAGLGCVEGRCAELRRVGQSCRAAGCVAGAVCVPGPAEGSADHAISICGVAGGLGAPCRTGPAVAPCVEGLACGSDHFCHVAAAMGEACAGRACRDGACINNACGPGVAEGGACAPGGPYCRDGLDCGSTGTCLETRALGEPCAEGSHRCTDSSCRDGVCSREVLEGESCDDRARRCRTDATCIEGFCRTPPGRLNVCRYRDYQACPLGLACDGEGNCAPRDLGRCGGPEDAPCPPGTGCELGRCRTPVPCEVDRLALCGIGRHCSSLYSPSGPCTDDGSLGGRCRQRGRPCDDGLICDAAELRCLRPPDGSGGCHERGCRAGETCVYRNCVATAPGDGERCEANAYCRAGHQCIRDTCRRANGTVVGSACVDGLCADGLMCLQSGCQPVQREGSACFDGSECPPSMRCIGDASARRCEAAGGASQRCLAGPGPRCGGGLGCGGDRCLPAVPRDAPCVVGETPCPNGQSCAAIGGQPARCVDDGTARGTRCREDSPRCADGLACREGVCVSGGLAGEACALGDGSARCADGYDCMGWPGVCRARGTPGGRCRATLPRCVQGVECMMASPSYSSDPVCFATAGEGAASDGRRCGDGLVSVYRADGPRCVRPGSRDAPCRVAALADVCDAGLRCDLTTRRCR